MAKNVIKILAVLITSAFLIFSLIVPTFAATYNDDNENVDVFKPFQDIEYIMVLFDGREYYFNPDWVFSFDADTFVDNSINDRTSLICFQTIGEPMYNLYVPVQYRIAKASGGQYNLIFYFLQRATIDGVVYQSPLFNSASEEPITFRFKLADGVYDSFRFNSTYQIRYGFTGNFKSANTQYQRSITAFVDGVRVETTTKTREDQSSRITNINRSFRQHLWQFDQLKTLGANADPSLFDLKAIYNAVPFTSVKEGIISNELDGTVSVEVSYAEFVKGYDSDNRYIAVSDVYSDITIPYSFDTNFKLYVPLTTDIDNRNAITANFINSVNFGDNVYDELIVEQLPSTFLNFISGFTAFFSIEIFPGVTYGLIILIPIATLVVLAIMRKFAGG